MAKRADEGGQDHVGQEHAAPDVAEPAGHHVRQATAGQLVVEGRARYQRAEQDQAATDPGDHQGPQDRPRGGAPGVVRLLRELTGRVEADQDVARHQPGSQQRAEAAHPAGVEHDPRTTDGIREQGDDQQHGADHLGGHADGVDEGHHLHRDRIDRGGDDQQHQAQHDGVGRSAEAGDRRITADELEAGPDRRQDRLHGDGGRGHGHDLRDDHGPAGEPADHVTAEATGPLVDRTGERVATRQLGEAQGHHQLADQDRRPGPEEEGPGEAEPDPNSWTTVVSIETNENPAANEA